LFVSAHTLQQTARDLFDLYRAIMPLQYQVRLARRTQRLRDSHSFVAQKETIKSVPSLGMAFHNDCFYLALHLLTLGMQYQDRYDTSPFVSAKASLADRCVASLITNHLCNGERRLPKDKGAFTLVDLVPVFRQLGEKQYQQQYVRCRLYYVASLFLYHSALHGSPPPHAPQEKQKSVLQETIQSAQGLADTHVTPFPTRPTSRSAHALYQCSFVCGL
jgi:hypothetical protein